MNRIAQAPLPQESEVYRKACRKLANEVLKQALKDLYGKRTDSIQNQPSARYFLFEDVREEWGFPFWCLLAGLDWRALRERLVNQREPVSVPVLSRVSDE